MSASRVPVRILGVLGGLLLGIAEFVTLFSIRSGGSTLLDVTGGEHHGYALLVLGIAAIALCWLATRPGAVRFLALLLLVVAAAAVLVVVAIDAPDLGVRGAYEDLTQVGTSRAGLGFFLESAGAVLVLVAGGLALLAPRGAPTPRPELVPDA